MKSTLENHADAGDTLRLTMVLLTLVLVTGLFTKRHGKDRAARASPSCSRSSRSSS